MTSPTTTTETRTSSWTHFPPSCYLENPSAGSHSTSLLANKKLLFFKSNDDRTLEMCDTSGDLYTSTCFRPWDVAQIVPRDRISPSETFEGVLKGMKALLYLLLIIFVWLCAICSQGSLLVLTSALIKVGISPFGSENKPIIPMFCSEVSCESIGQLLTRRQALLHVTTRG